MQLSDHSVSEAEAFLGKKAATLSPSRLCPVAEDCMFLCGLREAIFLGYLPSVKVEALSVTTSNGEKFSFY